MGETANLCEVWREAEDGEKLARKAHPDDPIVKGRRPDIGTDDLDADDWYIVGRWPVPTEPGWCWYRPECGEPPFAIKVTPADGGLRGNGTPVTSYPGTWGPRIDLPEEWQ